MPSLLRQQNSLLQSIPPSFRKSFASDLSQVKIDAHDRVFATGRRLANAYFPNGAVLSALCGSNGKTMEVHGVGREGLVGPDVLFAAEQRRFDWVCQIGGSMLYMPSTTFEQHLRVNAGLQRAVSLYSLGVIGSLAQSVACNGLHAIAQRCARWLLVTADRVNAPEFALTHELLARMLGVRRSGVSVAVYRLQKLEIIRYRFGSITILDRARLERESCECYNIVVRDTARIFRSRRA